LSPFYLFTEDNLKKLNIKNVAVLQNYSWEKENTFDPFEAYILGY
jgi:hypothetical protein